MLETHASTNTTSLNNNPKENHLRFNRESLENKEYLFRYSTANFLSLNKKWAENVLVRMISSFNPKGVTTNEQLNLTQMVVTYKNALEKANHLYSLRLETPYHEIKLKSEDYSETQKKLISKDDYVSFLDQERTQQLNDLIDLKIAIRQVNISKSMLERVFAEIYSKRTKGDKELLDSNLNNIEGDLSINESLAPEKLTPVDVKQVINAQEGVETIILPDSEINKIGDFNGNVYGLPLVPPKKPWHWAITNFFKRK